VWPNPLVTKESVSITHVEDATAAARAAAGAAAG